jgi:regulator of cell morphogenesis and NO signaling
MNELLSKSLAQIVTGNHRTAAVFEKYNLDFCCKGKRSLEKACAEKNIEAGDVVAELEALAVNEHGLTRGYPFEKLSLTQLSEYIVENHHSYVRNELPQLLAYAQKVTAKHGSSHPELSGIFDRVVSIKEELEMHLLKEEQILFPRLREIEQMAGQKKTGTTLTIQYLQSPIDVMELEHDHAGTLMAEIRSLSNNYKVPDDGCTTFKLLYASLQAFESDLHQHVHLENNLLFPKGMQLLEQLNSIAQNG